MIVVDSSALIAIARNEAEAQQFVDTLTSNSCVIGAPTRLEAFIVLHAKGSKAEQRILAGLFGDTMLSVVPFTELHAATASEAFRKYGKGQGHPAQLNFGDCMSDALAKLASTPLLYKGGDFTHTDVVPALSP